MNQQEALDQISFMQQLVEDTKLVFASGYAFFMLWGIVWIVGYVGQALLEARDADRLWAALIVAATVAQIVITVRSRRRPGWESTSLTKKLFRINLVLIGTALILPFLLTRLTLHTGLYIPFWVGVIYVINGIFLGKEMIVIGGWIVGCTLVATMLRGDAQLLWMALAGGGSLLFTGVLLRRSYRAATKVLA